MIASKHSAKLSSPKRLELGERNGVKRQHLYQVSLLKLSTQRQKTNLSPWQATRVLIMVLLTYDWSFLWTVKIFTGKYVVLRILNYLTF